MEDSKKEEIVKEEVVKQDEPPKKKSKALLYIIIGIVVFLIAISVAAFFVVKGLLKKGVDTVKDGTEWIEDVTDDYEISDDEDSFMYKKTTEEEVGGDLEKKDLVTEKFPKDIPLSGGVVTGSSYDEYSIEVKIDINSSVEEVIEWYAQKLEEEGWEITSKSSEERVEGWITGSIEFTKEERKGSIELETSPYQKVVNVTVAELLY